MMSLFQKWETIWKGISKEVEVVNAGYCYHSYYNLIKNYFGIYHWSLNNNNVRIIYWNLKSTIFLDFSG
jgi:hypothetical protein